MASNPLDTLTGQPLAGQALASALMLPPFAGWLFHQFLFGISVCNFWHYSQTEVYRRDSKGLKTLIWAVMILDFASTAVNFAQAMHYGSSQARDAVTLFLGVPHLDSVPFVLQGAVALLVQSFLALRCAKLFGERSMLRVLCLTVIFSFSALSFVGNAATTGLWVVATVSPMGPTQSQVYITNVVLGTSMWLSAATDILITVCLSLLLKASLTGFNTSTDHIVHKIIGGAMETALYTSILAVSGALMGVVFPQSNVSTINVLFAFISPLPSLYSLSLLVTLAARARLQKKLEGGPTLVTPKDFSSVVVSHERVTRTDIDTNMDLEDPRWRQRLASIGRSSKFPISISFDLDAEKQTPIPGSSSEDRPISPTSIV